ncbi:acyl-CoA dehydrogenase family protein [Amycolatopsis rubida]|uniref:Acyl-CoA dehydrogenase n=1 Tax=Amycolatopsis rubida TaxID=112413 RepID=A0A1I5S9A2_9PSEU|nr:acyl-CoA dehydrogenase family protein [Amycolatopsis rubida]SFP67301.1 Acyl-CoA dehydrogenase [Amycolatopsis rubida]
MNGELAPLSAAGEKLAGLAHRHAAEFEPAAARHDVENSFVAENVEAMRASRFLAGTVPESFGGLGVRSLHDLAVAVSRLARGCPATALSANMHLGAALLLARSADAAGLDPAHQRGLRGLLMLLGRCRLVLSHAGTEPGASLFAPATEAVPGPDGYRVTGRKSFATNAEVADVFTVFLRVPGADGEPRAGTAMIRRDTPGLRVERTWDALGMRGTGSHDVVFDGCPVPADAVRVRGRLGVASAEEWIGVLAVNYPMLGAYLGIAEAAAERARQTVRARARPGSAEQLAELRLLLTGARSALSRTGQLLDEHLAGPLGDGEAEQLMAEFQCAKLILNRAAVDAADLAMAVVGGRSYRSGDPLSRLYRDARAGGFMQPFSPGEARAFIGAAALADPGEKC